MIDRERVQYLEWNTQEREKLKRQIEQLEREGRKMIAQADAMQKEHDVLKAQFDETASGGAIPMHRIARTELDDFQDEWEPYEFEKH